MSYMTHIAHAYGTLLDAFRRTHNADEVVLAARINEAIILFEELWPHDCKQWREQFDVVNRTNAKD